MIITLNIGGKICQSLKSTLEKSEYFVKAFDFQKEEELFIDEEYKYFKHVLRKLRSENYILPNDQKIINVWNYFNPNRIYQYEAVCSKTGSMENNLYYFESQNHHDMKNLSIKFNSEADENSIFILKIPNLYTLEIQVWKANGIFSNINYENFHGYFMEESSHEGYKIYKIRSEMMHILKKSESSYFKSKFPFAVMTNIQTFYN
tara:strand:- start:369 stop:980 length:612 start_codon:yes stop_codon:yes gene_type:complete